MHELYNLKDTLCEELEEYSKKGKLSSGDLEIVDKLSHTVKNLCKIIEHCEEEEYSGNYMYESRGGGSRGGNRGGYSHEGYAMERRDSRGRYSRDASSMVHELRELMEDAPDERTRMEFEKFIHKVESM